MYIDGVLLPGRVLGGGSDPSPEILGLFHLKWLILLQIQSILTEMLGNWQLWPQQLHVYIYCWWLRGSIEPVEPPSLRACCSYFTVTCATIRWLSLSLVRSSEVSWQQFHLSLIMLDDPSGKLICWQSDSMAISVRQRVHQFRLF